MNVFPRIKPALSGLITVLCVLAAVKPLSAQVSTRVGSISPTDVVAGQPVTVTATLTRTEGLNRAVLVYRPFGESEYRQVEMDLRGSTARAIIPASTGVPPSLEYYIVFESGTVFETYPLSESTNPYTTPPERTGRITVHPVEETGILFLSPDTELPLPPEDVVISFSLLRVDSTINKKATSVTLDGVDITSIVVLSGDIGVVAPENAGGALTPGQHTVTVTLHDQHGLVRGTSRMDFIVSGGRLTAAAEAVAIRYFGSVTLESRHEHVDDDGTWYNRGTFTGGARYGDWRLAGNMFLTSDEKSSAQPQNRYYLGVSSPWIQAGYGDHTPTFPDLILSGKRVRGVFAAVTLGSFNVTVTQGQTARAIEGTLLETIPDSLLATAQAEDSTASYLKISDGVWGKYSLGTYKRNIFAIRPSFGSGEDWQFGFTWMKSKDDQGSIRAGSHPQENLVVGVDMVTKLDDHRVELSAQAAASAYNSDISSGNITDARIAELFPNDTTTVKSIRDILSHVITVNENLRPLSLKRFSTGAAEAALQLRYFDNVFKLSYLYRGSDYTSFGQTYLRKDVAGYNVSDRYRLLDNELLLTAGFERLTDNTSKTKAATTAYMTMNLSATYMPRRDFPMVMVGFSRYDNANNLDPAGTDSSSAVDNVTNRVYLQSSYDVVFIGLSHTVGLSVSSSNRTDATLRKLDVNAAAIDLSLASRFGIPLTTAVDLAANYNKLPSSTRGVSTRLDYTTLGLQARYEFIPSTLFSQASVSPTFGDFRRTVFGLTTEWEFSSGMRLIGEFSYYKNTDASNENSFSLRYRYDI